MAVRWMNWLMMGWCLGGVRAQPSRFDSFEKAEWEVVEYELTDGEARLVRSETVVRWDRAFRKTELTFTQTGTQVRIAVGDELRSTVQTKNVVEHYLDSPSDTPSLELDRMVLNAIGFSGGMEDFVATDSGDDCAVSVEVAEVVDPGGNPFRRIRRRSEPLGFGGATEIVVDVKTFGGRDRIVAATVGKKGQDHFVTTNSLQVVFPNRDAGLFAMDVIVQPDGAADGAADFDLGGQENSRCIRVRLRNLIAKPTADVFLLDDPTGNPVVRVFKSGELVSENPLRASDSSEPGWSPLEIWLIINNAVIGTAAIVIGWLDFSARRRKVS